MQKHGGDIYGNRVKYDFSVNVNPLGMPERVRQAAIEGVNRSCQYPDAECRDLIEAIARKEEIEKSNICVGNGAAELIFLLAASLRPKKALILAPTFGEYREALSAVDCEIVTYTLSKEDSFQVQEDILARIKEQIDLVILCNPNNPTGEVMKEELLLKILETCSRTDTFLMVDECFQDFIEPNDQVLLKPYLKNYENLFLLKAFTKMYGCAGLRLGYGLTSNMSLQKRMKALHQPWNISIPAQYAGIAACKEISYVNETRDYIGIEKKRLIKALEMKQYKIYGSKANYIFFQGTEELYEKFLEHGILIRSCESYEGLGSNYYRIAVKRKEENNAFIHVLNQIVS